VIKFWGSQHQNCSLDEMQIRLMKDSVERIEWALREVLPKYPTPPGTVLPERSQQVTSVSSELSTWSKRPNEPEHEESKTKLH
jgi:hypothetical protein